MSQILRTIRSRAGFTLIEVIAALTVFTIMTLGIAPLIASSFHGAIASRSNSVSKDMVQGAMERIRGLPYFVTYPVSSTRVDVLDFYFPNLTGGTGQTYSAATSTFTTTCTSTSTLPACPRGIAPGHTLTFAATFVKPAGGAPLTNETYTTVTPPAGYRFDATNGADTPPTQLLLIGATDSWTVGTKTRTYQVQTLISGRKSSVDKFHATSRIDYGLQVLAFYSNNQGNKQDLTLTAGTGSSHVASTQLIDADQSVRAGELDLIQEPLVAGGTSTSLGTYTGALTNIGAPPDASVAGANTGACTSPSCGTVRNTNITGSPYVGHLGASSTSGTTSGNVTSQVSSGFPSADGKFSYSNAEDPYIWATNQADTSPSASFHFDNSRPMFRLVPGTGANPTLSGSTTISSTATSLTSSATVAFPDMRLLPTSFIAGAAICPACTSVVVVKDFTATVSCTAQPAGPGSASVNWSATLYYWRDPNQNGLRTDGSYVAVPIGSAQGTDPLQAIKTANPLVYDANQQKDRVYLFPPGGSASNYLTNWKSLTGAAGTVTSGGRITSARLNGALQIDTGLTNLSIPESAMNLIIGKLSCQATDNR